MTPNEYRYTWRCEVFGLPDREKFMRDVRGLELHGFSGVAPHPTQQDVVVLYGEEVGAPPRRVVRRADTLPADVYPFRAALQRVLPLEAWATYELIGHLRAERVVAFAELFTSTWTSGMTDLIDSLSVLADSRPVLSQSFATRHFLLRFDGSMGDDSGGYCHLEMTPEFADTALSLRRTVKRLPFLSEVRAEVHCARFYTDDPVDGTVKLLSTEQGDAEDWWDRLHDDLALELSEAPRWENRECDWTEYVSLLCTRSGRFHLINEGESLLTQLTYELELDGWLGLPCLDRPSRPPHRPPHD